MSAEIYEEEKQSFTALPAPRPPGMRGALVRVYEYDYAHLMDLKYLIRVFVVFIFSMATSAFACSCIDHISIEQQIGANSLVFEGEVLETVPDDTLGTHYNSITTFRISNVHKGNLSGQVDIVHRLGYGSSCAIGFTPEQSALVFAHKREDGRYATGACNKGYGFSDEQIRQYLSTGQDILRLSYTCRYDFLDAYSNMIYTRKLKLKNPKCMQVKDLYDQENPIDPTFGFLDGKPVDANARAWSESILKYSCKIPGTETVDMLTRIPTLLLDQLDEDIEKKSAKELSTYAILTSQKRKDEMDPVIRDQLVGYLYAKAAAQEDPHAMFILGHSALRCRYGLELDTDAAAHWFTKAAKAGSKKAQIALAKLHLAGMTDATDREMAALELLDKCKDLKRRSCRKQYDWVKEAIDRR